MADLELSSANAGSDIISEGMNQVQLDSIILNKGIEIVPLPSGNIFGFQLYISPNSSLELGSVS